MANPSSHPPNPLLQSPPSSSPLLTHTPSPGPPVEPLGLQTPVDGRLPSWESFPEYPKPPADAGEKGDWQEGGGGKRQGGKRGWRRALKDFWGPPETRPMLLGGCAEKLRQPLLYPEFCKKFEEKKSLEAEAAATAQMRVGILQVGGEKSGH